MRNASWYGLISVSVKGQIDTIYSTCTYVLNAERDMLYSIIDRSDVKHDDYLFHARPIHKFLCVSVHKSVRLGHVHVRGEFQRDSVAPGRDVA